MTDSGMTGADPMPVVPVGTLGAVSVIVRDHTGISRIAGADDLRRADVLVYLFGGSAWMRRNFPGQMVPVPQRGGGYRLVPIGFDVDAVARYVVDRCQDADRARTDVRSGRAAPRFTRFARFRDWFACRFNLAMAGLS